MRKNAHRLLERLGIEKPSVHRDAPKSRKAKRKDTGSWDFCHEGHRGEQKVPS